MLFFDYFKNELEEFTMRFWSDEEKMALLKILHEIYIADKKLTDKEVDDFNEKAEKLKVSVAGAISMDMEQALEILSKDKLKHEFVYLLMAEAVFKDDDYDELEHEFIDKLEKNYQVSRVALEHHIQQIKDIKMDELMSRWIKDIDNTDLTKK